MKLLARLNNTLQVHKRSKDSREFVTALEDIIHRLEIISYTEMIETEQEENAVIDRMRKDLRQRLVEQSDKEKSELVKLQLSILSMLGPSRQ